MLNDILYWFLAGLAFTIIPLMALCVFLFAGKWEFDIPEIYRDWKQHLKSGEPWGSLDRGRKIR